MEDFIFDDDVDDVGAEVEAHCPKCKADTSHVIVSKYEDEIRRVQCKTCDDVHSYKKPRGENEEGEAEPTKPAKKVKAKPTWEQVMAKSKKQPRAYALGEYFKEMEIVSHPKFGVGYVTENIGSDKIEVTFQADKRVLIHNRKGLNLPVAMLRPMTPAATLPVKGKGAKGKGKKGEVAPAPVAAAKPAPMPAAKPAPMAAKPVVAAKPAPVAAKPVVAKQHPKAAARPAAKKPAKAPPQVKRAAKAASHKPAPKRPAAKKPARAAIRAKAPAKKIKKSR